MENSVEATARLAEVEARIAAAANETGRKLDDIALIAVSKTFSAENILPVLKAGQLRFGENRVQEAQGKWPALCKSHQGVELHLIGPLQSNKAKDAVALFDAIHTIDRLKIARVLAREIEVQKRCPALFIQVNTGNEPQKAGISIDKAGELYQQCRDEFGLQISGLMCIPPIDDDPEPHFKRLAELAAKLDLKRLSMGMSADYEIAIRCGSTHIRVGSAIFGTRPPQETTE